MVGNRNADAKIVLELKLGTSTPVLRFTVGSGAEKYGI